MPTNKDENKNNGSVNIGVKKKCRSDKATHIGTIITEEDPEKMKEYQQQLDIQTTSGDKVRVAINMVKEYLKPEIDTIQKSLIISQQKFKDTYTQQSYNWLLKNHPDFYKVKFVDTSIIPDPKFKDVYIQKTYDWLDEKFPDFRKVNLEDTTCLLTGKPQAGKSGFSFGVILMHLLLGKPVIFIVRNFTQDAEHMKAKLLRFAKEHTQQMKKYCPKTLHRTIGVVDAVQMSLVKLKKNQEEDEEDEIFSVTGEEEIKEALKGKNMNMVIALANGSQLKCINMVLNQLEHEGANNKELVMLTDEADSVAYSEIKDPSPLKHKAAEYVILKERCKQTYEISATVWDILRGNQDLTNTNIIYIRPPPTYKGIRDGVQFIELAHKIEKWDPNKTLFDEDPNLMQVYEELMETPIFSPKRYNCKIEHPVIVMHKTRTLIKHHKTFYELFRTSSMYCNIWTVMMECDKGLYLYSNVLKNKTIEIGKIKFSDTKGTGEFLFGKRIIIPQLMQWFIDNGGAKKFSHIVIKSGDFSGRSRSYVSTDGNWHLTHQYYGGGSSVPDMIQAQRLLHDRPDSIPLIEYAPSKVIDNIVKGDIMQDEQIERLIDLRITGNVEVLCHVQVAEEIWNKEKIPKASLCCGNVNKGFKIQKENRVEGEDGGWAVKRYNEILENIETMVNVMMTDSDDDEETSGEEIGKYIVINQNNFNPSTKIFKLIEDVEKIIIDNKLYNKDITVTWINEKLRATKYQLETDQTLHGALWNVVQTSKKLKHVSVKPSNSLVCWKHNGRLYLSLSI